MRHADNTKNSRSATIPTGATMRERTRDGVEDCTREHDLHHDDDPNPVTCGGRAVGVRDQPSPVTTTRRREAWPSTSTSTSTSSRPRACPNPRPARAGMEAAPVGAPGTRPLFAQVPLEDREPRFDPPVPDNLDDTLPPGDLPGQLLFDLGLTPAAGGHCDPRRGAQPRRIRMPSAAPDSSISSGRV
ncbi:MAG: hypothetical protein ACF8PN_04665 [Phycisphaerales bacterium]